MTRSDKPRLLLIGPLPPPIGGTRVSFRHLVDHLCSSSDFDLSVVPLPPLRANPLHMLSLVARLAREVPRADVVSLHCNPSALWLLGVLVAMLAKAARKPLMVRTFGGMQFLREYRGIRLALTRWALARTDLYLAQTKAQVAMARAAGIEPVRWYPTNRPMPQRAAPRANGACSRFVFCGHIKRSKGIFEIIEAAEALGDRVAVDVYGPFHDGLAEDVFRDCRVVRYRGIVPPEQVASMLQGYDALLLPTYFDGEGYPGIVIEAYGAGLPVIATRWRSLPEIVDESSGLLIAPRDPPALRAAMRSLIEDRALWRSLKAGAARSGQLYSLDYWAPRFAEFCAALAAKRAPVGDPKWGSEPLQESARQMRTTSERR